MTKHFLITRPTYDRRTSYLFSFSKAIVTIAKNDPYIHLTELQGSKANRKNLEKELTNNEKTLVFLNGHGDPKTVYGYKNLPILDKDNVKLTKQKIVYSLACDSLVRLGQLAVKKGALAYIGYLDEFWWIGDPSKSAVPDKDENAAPFRKVCHVLINSLLSGVPVGKAIEKTKIEYKKLIRTYGNSEDSYGDAPAIGIALSWNLLALDMAGDPSAVF